MSEEELTRTLALKFACVKIGKLENRDPDECMTELIKMARVALKAVRAGLYAPEGDKRENKA